MGKASRRKSVNSASNLISKATNTVRRLGWAENIEIRQRSSSTGKISGALAQLLEGEVPPGSDLEEYQACLDFIALAWNISLLDHASRKSAIDDLGQSINAEGDQVSSEVLHLIESLVQKKLALFPDDKRTVLSWSVQIKGNNVAVSAVAASPDNLPAN